MTAFRHAAAQRRLIWPPKPGFFVLGLVRGGWRVPARIVHTDQGWHAEVDGEVHSAHTDPAHAPMVDAIWHGGVIVSEADYRWFVALKDWARTHDPDHPALHPRRKIDPRLLKPISPEGRHA